MDDLTATFDAHVEPVSTAEHVEALTPVALMQIAARLTCARRVGPPWPLRDGVTGKCEECERCDDDNRLLGWASWCRGPLFSRRDGGVWQDHDWRNWRKRVFQPAATAAGLVHARPYDLRGSFASLLIQAGKNVVDVAKQLGHTPESCLRYYARIFDEAPEHPIPRRKRSAPRAVTSPKSGLPSDWWTAPRTRSPALATIIDAQTSRSTCT